MVTVSQNYVRIKSLSIIILITKPAAVKALFTPEPPIFILLDENLKKYFIEKIVRSNIHRNIAI